jgi:4,5-DOPA dioxygenase extradiol
MIALEPGAAGAFMQRLGPLIDATFGRPKAIVSVSAHTAASTPVLLAAARHEAIYDFGGFDPRLRTLRYDASGDPALAERIATELQSRGIAVQLTAAGGLDHGAWTALRYLYPAADIPIVPLAFVPSEAPEQQFALGAALEPLAEEEVLVSRAGASRTTSAWSSRVGCGSPTTSPRSPKAPTSGVGSRNVRPPSTGRPCSAIASAPRTPG